MSGAKLLLRSPSATFGAFDGVELGVELFDGLWAKGRI